MWRATGGRQYFDAAEEQTDWPANQEPTLDSGQSTQEEHDRWERNEPSNGARAICICGQG